MLYSRFVATLNIIIIIIIIFIKEQININELTNTTSAAGFGEPSGFQANYPAEVLGLGLPGTLQNCNFEERCSPMFPYAAAWIIRDPAI